MVLEHIFPEAWLEKKTYYAFVLGAVYSIIGIFISKFLFPSDPALVAVAFTALLLLPELYKMFSIEERQEREETKFSFKNLFKDENDFVKVYIFLFIGILVVYSIATIMLPSFEVNTLFREQLEIRGAGGSAAGGAHFSSPLFWSLLSNNFWVLIACFIISLLTGDGAIFLITWNASVWGTIFGLTARNAAIFSNSNPFFLLIIILAIVFPHMIIEALAYILAAISGGLISKDVLLESFDSARFNNVFIYNSVLLLVAIGVLFLGAYIETLVLNNISIYGEIIKQSYMALG